MRSKLLLLTSLAGLSATGLALSRLPAAAADDVKSIAIIKNEAGKFVFTDTNAKIEEGQTVKWVAVDEGVTHQLVPDSEDDALTDTGAFDSTAPATQKLATAGTDQIPLRHSSKEHAGDDHRGRGEGSCRSGGSSCRGTCEGAAPAARRAQAQEGQAFVRVFLLNASSERKREAPRASFFY